MFCPHCGSEIKDDATFCRHCGSNESIGWNQESSFVDEELDYNEILENEFGDDPKSPYFKKKKASPAAVVAVVIIVAAFLAATIF